MSCSSASTAGRRHERQGTPWLRPTGRWRFAPWEYRHLLGFARVRIASAFVLVSLGLVTLSVGGHDAKAYAWTLAFLAAAAAQYAWAYWELTIARSASPRT
jgi:hypothetical protein